MIWEKLTLTSFSDFSFTFYLSVVLFRNPKFNPTHHNPGYIIQNRAIDTDDVYVIVLELDGARERLD